MALTQDLTQRAEARVGTVLSGKWTLDAVLGLGGMAAVYAATHRNKKRAAIKMLHPEVSIDASITTRFLREGYVANTVEHPGTVMVLDDDVTPEGAAYLVMELLEGETLEARRERKGGSLPPAEVLSLMAQLLDVLTAAHAKGIVHRDLKPENLFLTDDGRLKVLDFGIARFRELSAGSGAGTQAGSLLGTPAFMAPEQARGRTELVDGRTDLWAVGATMFTLITGRSVHEAETVQEQLIYAATTPAPSLATLAPSLPPRLVKLVDRAMAFDKAERWPDARSMRDALRGALEQALPDGPVSLLLAPTSARATEDAATMVAPSTRVPAITAVGTQTTTRPLAGSVDVGPTRKLGLAAAAGAVAIAVAIGAVLVLRGGSAGAVSTTSTSQPGASVAHVGAVRDPGRVDPAAKPADVEAPVAPATTSTSSASPSATATPDGTSTRSKDRPRPATGAPPATTAAPPTTTTPPPKKTAEPAPKPPEPPPASTGNANPFDRRF